MIQDIAPHHYDVTYRTPAVSDDTPILIYHNDQILCHFHNNEISYPTAAQIAAIVPSVYEKAKFLFRIDSQDYFELRNPVLDAFDKWNYQPKSIFRQAKPIWLSYAGVTGMQIHNWYSNNAFCGHCGTPMIPHGRERAMHRPSCGHLAYPQICPSVIVGILHDDQILLTRYAPRHSSFQRYALVAGYAEVGESLEDTVRREVMEEVGLHVKNIRYYKSQPWSFTDTLLVGYFCEADGDTTIRMDKEELSCAEWFRRDAIPDETSDPAISLTGEMIACFKNGKI